MKRNGHSVAHRDCAGFIQKKNVDIAGCFDSAATCCQHVSPNESINTADANRAQQPANCSRDETNEQRNENWNADIYRILLTGGGFAVASKRRKCEDGENKQRSQTNEQDAERDFVRCFLPTRAFDQTDHSVDKCVALLARNPDDDAVAHPPGSACDRAAVAAALADDRC